MAKPTRGVGGMVLDCKEPQNYPTKNNCLGEHLKSTTIKLIVWKKSLKREVPTHPPLLFKLILRYLEGR
jgi:hypothetical protein